MERILVAVDESPRAPAVLRAAVALARRMTARLVLFRAVSLPVELPPVAFSLPPDQLPRLLEEQAKKRLAELGKDVPPELLAETRTGIGSPWEAICRAAKEAEAGMIVVGSHGYGVLDRVLGTTAAKVVNHADRTVVVVRAPELLERGGA